MQRSYPSPEGGLYMHAGQFATLDDVIVHYDGAPAAPFGHSEFRLSARKSR